MRFEDTGLKKDKVVEEAFNYAYAYNRALAPEVTKQWKDEFEFQHQSGLDYYDKMKTSGQIPEEQYKSIKAQLDSILNLQMKQLPQIVEQQLGIMFGLAPTLEVQQYSEKSTPSLLAATLLIGCVRDPVDCQKVEEKFGSAISGLIAEMLHIEAYPGTLDVSMTAASSDAKRIFMAELTSNLNQAKPQMKFPPKEEEKMFSQAKLLWGNDKKLDTRLVDVFNRVAEALFPQYRIEVGAAGAPELVKTEQKTPKLVPGQKKGPIISGDDGI